MLFERSGRWKIRYATTPMTTTATAPRIVMSLLFFMLCRPQFFFMIGTCAIALIS